MKKYVLPIVAGLVGIATGFLCLGVVWRDGFDTGADVDQCLFSYAIYQDVKVLETEPACLRARKAKDGIIWKAFARKDGGK